MAAVPLFKSQPRLPKLQQSARPGDLIDSLQIICLQNSCMICWFSELAYQRNDEMTSIEVLQPLAFRTKDPRIAAMVTRRAINSSRYDIAAKTGKLWVEIEPQSESAWLANSIIHLETKEYDRVVENFVNFIQNSAQGIDQNLERIAVTISRRSDPEIAYQLFAELMINYPLNVAGHIQLVNLAIGSGAGDADIDALFATAFAIAPESDLAATYKFSLLLERKQTDDANEFAKSHLKKYAQSARLREAYATYLSQVGFYREAVTQYEILGTNESIFRVGLLHQRANRKQLARSAYERYFELSPDDQNVYVQFAELAIDQNQFDVALEWIQKISIDAFQFERHLLYASYIANTDSVDKGVEFLLNYAVQSNDQWIRIYLLTDEIYRISDQLLDAKLVLDEALEKFPGNTTLLLARSFALAELKMIPEFERDIQILLKNNPDDSLALNAFGYTLADQTDRLGEALGFIQHALDLRPNDPYVLDSMGWVQYKLGNIKSAIEFLELALDRRRDPVMAAHLGEVYWANGEKIRAKRIWNEVLAENPDSKFLIETIRRFTEQ